MASEQSKGKGKKQRIRPPDPRQMRFLELYLDPDSLSYSNALQAALRAGYSEGYAKQIMNRSRQWLGLELVRNDTGPTPEQIIDRLWREADSAMKAGDRIRALEVLAKIRKLFTDGATINVTNFGTAIFNVSEASDEQLDSIIAQGLDIVSAARETALSGRDNGTDRATSGQEL